MGEIKDAGTASLADQNTDLIQSGLTPGLPVQYANTKQSKGALDYTKPNPNYLMDKQTETNVLQNMQNLADKINNPLRMFNESMKDAQAWTQYNKSPAFALREEAAGKDRQALYDIAQQQTAIKIAQQQAAAEAANIARFKNGIVSNAGGVTPAQQQVLNAMGTHQDNSIGAQRALMDKYNEQQIIGSSKAQYDAAANTPTTYMVPGKGLRSITVNQWNNMDPDLKREIEIATYKELGGTKTGAAGPLQGNVPTSSLSAPTTTGERGNATQIAAALNIPLISGDRDWDKQYNLYLNSKQPNYSGPPVAFPGTSKHQTGYAIDAGPINPAQRQQLIDAGFKQTVARDPNHWELVNKPAQVEQAPVAPVGGLPQVKAPVVSGGLPVATSQTPVVAAQAPAKVIASAQAPVAQAPTQAPTVQGPSAVQSAQAMEPMPQAKDYGLNKDAYLAALDAWKARQTQKAQGLGTASTELSKQDADKKNEYLSSVGTTQKTYDEYERLLNASKGKSNVFNLAGSGWLGPIGAKVTPKLATDKTEHHALARTWLSDKAQTDFKNIEQGAAVAQAAWAKNLVQGAGGRLTNADLALGEPAKGVGIATTYGSHMENLAKNMQDIRTAYYRGLEFDKWSRQNPNGTAAQFEDTPYYKFGSKVDAAKDVGKKFIDVPEANYVKKDANEKPYIIVNGKSIYL
jgi:hypothetical protein